MPTYTRVGGLLSFVMPAVAFGATAYMKDGEGAWQVTKSMAVTGVITLGFKYSVRSRRPNGDPYSFPSGHAAFAMASAQFLGQRYGWEYGVPAYVLAAFSAHSRVWAHEHYLKDVAPGRSLASSRPTSSPRRITAGMSGPNFPAGPGV